MHRWVEFGELRVASEVKWALDNPEGRPAHDWMLDYGHKPDRLAAFLRVGKDSRIAILQDQRLYFVRFFSQVVGLNGQVFYYRLYANPWENRESLRDLITPVATNVTVSPRFILDADLPQGLDCVLIFTEYHDTFRADLDRALLNRKVMSALKPGGTYGIVDHHAPPGRGVQDVDRLHRIEREVVVEDLTGAGFELLEETDLYLNPTDPLFTYVREPSIQDHSSRFALRFVKPGGAE